MLLFVEYIRQLIGHDRSWRYLVNDGGDGGAAVKPPHQVCGLNYYLNSIDDDSTNDLDMIVNGERDHHSTTQQ